MRLETSDFKKRILTKIVCFIFMTILLYSCNGGKNKSGTNKATSPRDASAIKESSALKKFDIEGFNKNLVNDERNFTDENGNIIHQYKTKEGFQEDLTEPNSYFFISRLYYKNGVLAEKGQKFKEDGFLKGIWTNYDINGRVTKQIDYDAPFIFTWENVLTFMKTKNIDPADDFTYVGREVNDSGPVWTISWDTKEVTPDGKKILKGIYINGETGTTSKEETEYYGDTD